MKTRFGTLGVNALSRAVGPLLIAGEGADVFRPALDDVVAAEHVLAAFRSRDRHKTGARTR